MSDIDSIRAALLRKREAPLHVLYQERISDPNSVPAKENFIKGIRMARKARDEAIGALPEDD